MFISVACSFACSGHKFIRSPRCGVSIRSAILKEVRSWGVLGAILSLYWHTSTSTAPLRASKTPSEASKNFRTHPGPQLFSPYKILHIKKVFITFEITLNNTALYLRSNTYHNHSVSSFSRGGHATTSASTRRYELQSRSRSAQIH